MQTKLNERNGTEKKKQVNIIWHINREGTLTYNNEFDYRIKLTQLIKQDSSKSSIHWKIYTRSYINYISIKVTTLL